MNISLKGVDTTSPKIKKTVSPIRHNVKKNQSPKREHKINFLNVNKEDVKYKPLKVTNDARISPTRLDKISKTKVQPSRLSING